MKKTLEVGIIGLGKFGRQLGIVLTELGHNVLGVDIDPQRVHAVQDIFPQTYVADATDKTALDQLKLQSCDTVAVSVGSTMDSSILITLNLQEIGAKDILVKGAYYGLIHDNGEYIAIQDLPFEYSIVPMINSINIDTINQEFDMPSGLYEQK